MDVIKLDYIKINKGLKGESSLLIGHWLADGSYIPLYREELECNLIGRCWDDEPEDRYSSMFYKRISRPA